MRTLVFGITAQLLTLQMIHAQGATDTFHVESAAQTDSLAIATSHALTTYLNNKEATEDDKLVPATIQGNPTKKHPIPAQFNKYGAYLGPVSATKRVSESRIEGEKNVRIDFSNGLVFSYFEGEAKAWYANKEVKIEGKYRIAFPHGIAKISYDPKGGTAWWVVENR